MHPLLVRHLVKPLLNRAAGRRSLSRLRELEETQWLAPERLRGLQWEKLRRLLSHAAAHVPYYRQRFDELGLDMADFRGPDDLALLPTLSKATIRDRAAELVADGAVGLLGRQTSGSTGIPVRSMMDHGAQEWWLAAARRWRRWWGVDLGARKAVLATRSFSRGTLVQRYLYNEARFRAVELTEAVVHGLIRELFRFHPVLLQGLPTHLTYISRLFEEHPEWPRLDLKVVSTSGEVLYPDQRALIGRAFSCPVANQYGSTENGVIAAECPEGRMHVTAENHLLEFRPVAPGADLYEILITDLNNYGMPFIRYAIGDLGRPVAGHCPCGRGLPLLDVQSGRVSDVAITSDGRTFDSNVFVRVLEGIEGGRVRQFQIIQEAVDRFIVLVSTDSLDGVAEKIDVGFRGILGAGPRVEIRKVDSIPQDPSGKLRRFISRLDHPAIRHGPAGENLRVH
jgi:phenylacetate-CoA ligase